MFSRLCQQPLSFTRQTGRLCPVRRPVTLCRPEVSVAFVSLLRGSFDHVVPCAVSPDGMCHLPDPGTAL